MQQSNIYKLTNGLWKWTDFDKFLQIISQSNPQPPARVWITFTLWGSFPLALNIFEPLPLILEILIG